MLDALRLIAAICVIWAHASTSDAAKPWRTLATWSLPFFTAAAILFLFDGLRRDHKRTLAGYVQARLRRTYVPFLIWSAIYLLLRWVERAMLDPHATPSLTPVMLVTGTARHLWFLPFLMVASIGVFPLAKWTVAAKWRGLPVAVISIAVGVWLVLYPPIPRVVQGDTYQIATETVVVPSAGENAMGFPSWVWSLSRSPFGYLVERSWSTLPSVFWGVALGALAGIVGPVMRSSSLLGAIGAVAFVVLLALYTCGKMPERPADNIAGVACVLVGLMPWTSRIIRSLASRGGATYAIYLVHIAILEAVTTLLLRGAHLTEGLPMDILLFVLTAILSVIAGVVIVRSRAAALLAPS